MSEVFRPKTILAIYSSNMELLSSFYKEALELNLLESGDGYICLGNAGIEINILQMNGKPGKTIEVVKELIVREETPIKCSFHVRSYSQVIKAVAKYGGNLKNEDEAWDWRGYRHLDGYDPEGNVVQYRIEIDNK